MRFGSAAIHVYETDAWLVVIIPLPGLPNVCSAKSYDQQLYLYWVFMIIVDAGECSTWCDCVSHIFICFL